MPLVLIVRWINCTPPPRLSITHKFCSEGGAQRDVSETRQSAPHDGIPGRRIIGAGEIAAEPGDLGQVMRERSSSERLLISILHEIIEQADLMRGQCESR